jgi:hypothetical protein
MDLEKSGSRELDYSKPSRPRDSIRVPDGQQVEGTFFEDISETLNVPSISQSKLLKSLPSKRVAASTTPRQWRQYFNDEGITPEEIAWPNLDYFLGL